MCIPSSQTFFMQAAVISPKKTSPHQLFESIHDIGSILRKHVEEEEMNRRLSKEVLNCLRDNNLFKLFVPASFGGLELDPLTVASLVEEVATYNTAAAWSMMVANTSAFWCSRLPDEGIEKIYGDNPNALVAGAFHPPMSATPTNGGYLINGRSPLTSNAHEADWIFVSAFVMEDGKIKMNNGIPEVIGTFMRSNDCTIIDTWYTIGMKATDSNDIGAENVFVPSQLSFPLMPEFVPNSYYQGLLYKFPAIGASIASLISPVALAVARNAIEELKILSNKKVPFGSMVPIRERGVVQRKLGQAEALVQSSKAFLHHQITYCWNKTLAGEPVSLEERANLLLAVTHTNQSCLQATELMYSAAGTAGIYQKNKLSRYFTDAEVIRHHGFSNESRYETAAQVFFGLQPDLPVIMF
jgi:alkylation response protein AidB-like acyl-CoA dehydrogenase